MESDVSFKVRAARASFNYWDHIELFALKKVGKSRSVAQSLVMQDEEMGATPPAFCSLEKEQAQQLMDDLWDCGIRPSEGSGSAGALAATQRHLADLKTILFHKFGIAEAQK